MPTPTRRSRRTAFYATTAARRLKSWRPRRKSVLARLAEAVWGSSWLVRQALVAFAVFLIAFAVLKGASPLLAGLQGQLRYYLTTDYDIRGAAQQVMSSNFQEKVAGGLRVFPEFWDRLTGRDRDTDTPPQEISFVLPVPSGVVTSNFGYRRDPITSEVSLHTGVDIAAAEGEPIVAAFEGVVLSVGEEESYGKLIEIDHGRGIVTLYAHVRDILVSTGDAVKTGDQIATVGMTGRATSPHCHFEVIVSGQPVDPLSMPGLVEVD